MIDLVVVERCGETEAPHNCLIAGAIDSSDRRVVPVGEAPPARKLCGGLVYLLVSLFV